MRVLFLNPFHGGSHRAFAEGWVRASRHRIDLVSLPARFWKWRMRGAALHFVRKVENPRDYDALVVTDLMSLADLKALWGEACPPALAYFHENQLSYPLPPGETMDYQFGFTDITTCLAAARVLFNSRFQHDAFFARLPSFIGMMPESHPRWVIEAIRSRASVLHPGVDLPSKPERPRRAPGEPPLVVWNHRWEFDKNPGAFFAAIDAALGRGLDLRLALLGENFQVVPKEFEAARSRYGERVVQYGWVADRAAYLGWLGRGDVVISTAEQENFGMAVVEAIRMGCRPLLPRRLSYPEILPERFHAACLYDDPPDLIGRLSDLLSGRCPVSDDGALAESMQRFAWPRVIGDFDRALDVISRCHS